MKVFLGGTCNNSTWRDELIPLLNIDYFNPVVDDWTLECQKEEILQRENCDYCLYVITPEMIGSYSIAEVVDDSNKRPEKTIFCVLHFSPTGIFNKFQMKSFRQIETMIISNGGRVFQSLKEIAEFLNKQ